MLYRGGTWPWSPHPHVQSPPRVVSAAQCSAPHAIARVSPDWRHNLVNLNQEPLSPRQRHRYSACSPRPGTSASSICQTLHFTQVQCKQEHRDSHNEHKQERPISQRHIQRKCNKAAKENIGPSMQRASGEDSLPRGLCPTSELHIATSRTKQVP